MKKHLYLIVLLVLTLSCNEQRKQKPAQTTSPAMIQAQHLYDPSKHPELDTDEVYLENISLRTFTMKDKQGDENTMFDPDGTFARMKNLEEVDYKWKRAGKVAYDKRTGNVL